jgi:hypothetical protein
MPKAARQALGLGPAESAALGMSLSPSDAVPDLDVGLDYPGTPAQATGNVSTLWAADVSDHAVLERGVIAPAAWNEASLRWMIAPADLAASSDELRGGVQIGTGDALPVKMPNPVSSQRENNQRPDKTVLTPPGGRDTPAAINSPGRRRGTIFAQGSKPGRDECSPAGGHQTPSLPYRRPDSSY